MKFEYKLNDVGWADTRIEINSQVCFHSVSYISNALGDLLEKFFLIIPGCVPADELCEEVSFDWHSEPGGIQWTLSQVNEEEIRVKIIGYPHIFEKDASAGTVEIDTVCNIFDFAQQLCGALDELLKIHGIVGYKQTWILYEFPLSDYLRLKDFLCSRQMTYNKVFIDGWREVYTSNLKEELEVLSSLLNSNPRQELRSLRPT